jgi:hypothetical protein
MKGSTGICTRKCFRREVEIKEHKIPLPGSKTWDLFISKICRRYNDVL